MSIWRTDDKLSYHNLIIVEGNQYQILSHMGGLKFALKLLHMSTSGNLFWTVSGNFVGDSFLKLGGMEV